MTRTLFVKLFLASMIICTTAAYSWADIRIRFARGRTSATMTGRVAGDGGQICYVAGARRGQTLTATVSSKNGKVIFFESGETTYNLNVDIPGDQSFCVENLGRTTTYTLTVSIR